MPGATIWREGKPDICCSLRCARKRIVPLVSGKTPVTRLNMGDLPAPLGPIRPTICPARTLKLMSLTATRPRKFLACVFNLKYHVAIRMPGAGRQCCRRHLSHCSRFARHQFAQIRRQTVMGALQQKQHQNAEYVRMLTRSVASASFASRSGQPQRQLDAVDELVHAQLQGFVFIDQRIADDDARIMPDCVRQN